MKSKNNLLEQLKSLPHFDKNTVYQLGIQLGIKDSTVNTYISRFLKYKEIYRLKNGLYISADFFYKNRGDISYLFYLANITRKPSYVSSWTALQYYGLTTEAIHSYTSVTPKVTRNYQTKAANFTYQSITNDLFSGFSLKKEGFDFFIASPSKALFDLLYFRSRQFRVLKAEDIKRTVEELRIDIDEINKSEQVNFYKIIERYYHE